jgi:phosphomannomutase
MADASTTLMISVSGMRGIVGTDLTPELVARHAAALGAWAKSHGRPLVVLGRDSRTSGSMFARAATAGLMSVGADVIDLGVVPTPTTQLAVEHHQAGAGLIITASHNPIAWNALKFVGPDGIFLDAAAGGVVRGLANDGPPRAGWDQLGSYREDRDAVARHLDAVLKLPQLDIDRIRGRRFHVALDCVRGAGAVIIPQLLQLLGCRVSAINLEPDGRFPREPEPIPENLGELGRLVRDSGADIGMAVDPDVDRLALVEETGRAIGEDYTLAWAVRAVLHSNHRPAGTDGRRPVVVANLSTSLVVEDATVEGGGAFVRAPVGEANVAQAIKEQSALVGGEGNGGVILPELHIGRDAPLGVALILQYLALANERPSQLVRAAKQYHIVKSKSPRGADLDLIYAGLQRTFTDAQVDARDGLRLSWPDRWIHVRPSGTEPIIRFIAEAPTEDEARAMIATCQRLA